jgi:hypothetical protein
VAREAYTTTQLEDSRVLVMGGIGTGGALGSAELYDPATRSCTSRPLDNFASGPALATVFVNGIPSPSKVLRVISGVATKITLDKS